MRLLVVGAPKYMAHVACAFVQILVFIHDLKNFRFVETLIESKYVWKQERW